MSPAVAVRRGFPLVQPRPPKPDLDRWTDYYGGHVRPFQGRPVSGVPNPGSPAMRPTLGWGVERFQRSFREARVGQDAVRVACLLTVDYVAREWFPFRVHNLCKSVKICGWTCQSLSSDGHIASTEWRPIPGGILTNSSTAFCPSIFLSPSVAVFVDSPFD